ncbi:MAG: cysteine synthase A [Desulfobacteraceae bacterium]|nr:cysteine synthase A [Desulfobacteraceae bacterium]MCB9494635.1 cysteine synthase A [Desulfobacteraceae bacterium]
MQYFTSLFHSIGKTPLFKIDGLHDTGNNIFVKAEYFNPLGSVKDRAARYILEGGIKTGQIYKGVRIVEPTSGNTGIALAGLCSVSGYDITLVMPSSMSVERQKLLKYLGANLVLTDSSLGMKGAIDFASKMIENNEADFMPDQFSNKFNAMAHYETTGPEIYEALEGNVDSFVAGVGTGGTITGTGSFLKEKNRNIKIVAVEPEKSAVLSGKKPSSHLIQGIGGGFIPDLLDVSLLDEVVTVSDEMAVFYAKRLALEKGLFCGISSGAAVYASIAYSEKYKNQNLNIVTILPSTGERYLSTALFQ